MQEFDRQTDPTDYVLHIRQGWNFVSLARVPDDKSVTAIFGDAIKAVPGSSMATVIFPCGKSSPPRATGSGHRRQPISSSHPCCRKATRGEHWRFGAKLATRAKSARRTVLDLETPFFFTTMFEFLRPKLSQNFVRIPLEAPGRLYASPMPYGPYDPANRLIRQYRKHHINVVVPLVTDEEVRKKAARNIYKVYAKEGYEVLRFTIPDLTSPSLEEVCGSLHRIVEMILAGKRAVVHCNAGLGRTGVVLACVRAHIAGEDGDTAIEFVRQFLHLNMVDEQIRFVHKWTASIA